MQNSYAKFLKGDFSSLANCFTAAGFLVEQPLTGVVQICSTAAISSASPFSFQRMRLLISAGVHGDETAPIAMLAMLLDELSHQPQLLAVDLMIVLGNLSAIAHKQRFIQTDLNRLFLLQKKVINAEAQRAEQLMQVTAQFFAGHPVNRAADHTVKWHLDLHSTIRASQFSSFAILPGNVPGTVSGNAHSTLLHWLGQAGMQAVVLSPQTSSATFSAYTSKHLGAISCTAELGCITEASIQFPTTQHALANLLRSGTVDQKPLHQPAPVIFRVAQELTKHSDAFEFTFDGNTKNFTEFTPATILAKDGENTWVVGAQPEYILFPNQDVHIGLRAGLMLVRAL